MYVRCSRDALVLLLFSSFDFERKKRGKLRYLYQKIIYTMYVCLEEEKTPLNDIFNKKKVSKMMVLFFFSGKKNSSRIA